MKPNREKRNQRGVVLVTLALCAVALFGAAALAIDAGRLFVNRNEAQTFADSAALAAALELDGTRQGIAEARASLARNENRWDFESKAFAAPVIEFSRPETPNAWEPDPARPANYTRVRVTVRLEQRLLFAPIVGGPLRRTIGAVGMAAAEQIPQTHFYQGLWPFAASGELAPGTRLPIRDWWGAGAPSAAASRILTDLQMPGERVAIGEPLPAQTGAVEDPTAHVRTRVLQDTDPEAASYQAYLAGGKGNGRRIVVMPVQESGVVKAFGMFFLMAEGDAAEYTGRAYLPNSLRHGAGPPGAYSIRLVGGLP
ncbi:MAG: Tad domain-containing protein [Bryobacteraceae bacterium]|nr:Tad domain-containing protein [Bryobacteraceae bacterium]